MDYSYISTTRRQRNTYKCNICLVELDGYAARNNHFNRTHTGIRMSYTTLIDTEGTQVTANANEGRSDIDNNAINNENMTYDDDGDIQIEDQNVETCKFTSLLPSAATITIYLPIPDFFIDDYNDDPITPDDIVQDDSGDVEDSTSGGEGVNLNIPYKTSGKFIGGDDPVCVYDDSGTPFEDLKKVELYSIHLADLVSQYAVPRECHRQLVRLMNTMIRDHDEMKQGRCFTFL